MIKARIAYERRSLNVLLFVLVPYLHNLYILHVKSPVCIKLFLFTDFPIRSFYSHEMDGCRFEASTAHIVKGHSQCIRNVGFACIVRLFVAK